MTDSSTQAAPTVATAPRKRRRLFPIALIASALIVGSAGYVWYDSRIPKRFAAVVDGHLYRSGGVSPRQLEYVARRYGIRTVISLLNPEEPETIAEQQAAARLGLSWHNIFLPGNGASTPADRDRIRRLLSTTPDEPTLVHCAAGTNRTGLAIGMYRIDHDGWTVEQVLSEMKQFDFDDEPHHQNLRDALAAEAARTKRRTTTAPHP